MNPVVDQDTCTGCALCTDICPEVFEMGDDGIAKVINANPGDVVMTTQPYTLNYASGRPTIVLPGNEPPDSAWEAAQRYGARFLVITQTFGQYPEILRQQPDPRFRLLVTMDTTEIYEIGGGQP